MKQEINEIEVNGIKYVKKDSIQDKAESFEGMEYVLIRTYSAGVFVGYLELRDGKEVKLRQARRIWYWDGAASLSQLAMEGTSKPESCKFPCEVNEIVLTEAIEIITVTKKAKISIDGVAKWEK